MKDHLAFKFIALILCACALFVTVASTVGIVSFVNIGLYSSSLEDLQDKQMAEELGDLAERMAMYYATRQTECTEAFLNGYFKDYDERNEIRSPKDGTWYYEIIDYNSKQSLYITPGAQETAGAILYKEYLISTEYPKVVDIVTDEEAGQDALIPELPVDQGQSPKEEYPEGSFSFEFYNEEIFKKETYMLLMEDGPIYKVKLFLLPGAYEQEVAYTWELMEIGHTYRYRLFMWLAAGLLALGICLTYLASAAGRKPGRKELSPAALNRLPLDLYLTAIVVAVVFLADGYVQAIRHSFSRDTASIVILSIVFTGWLVCLMGSGFFFACAAQIKRGGQYWWTHSALYHLLKLLRRGGRSLVQLVRVCYDSLRSAWRRFLELLPLTWQWILWAVVMCGALVLAVLSENVWIIIAALVFVAASFFYALHAFKILFDGARRMSRGDLNTQVDKDQLMGGFAEFATHLNALADVAVVAAQKQMRSERMRAELITNVSHDIKTPLTSIINYVDLLKKAESRESAEQYLEVLSRQSLRMKKLIDDLIELSKASTGNMPVDIQTADAVEYLNQALGEFSDKLEAVPITPVFEAPDEPVYMRCDSRLTWRVLSNLMSNAVKYALPGTRLYVDVTALPDTVLISLKNISRQPLNVSSEELMERFVRGDTSRNTEGSGLGLNIAKSLMELQKGQLKLLADGDLFKATLVFPREQARS